MAPRSARAASWSRSRARAGTGRARGAASRRSSRRSRDVARRGRAAGGRAGGCEAREPGQGNGCAYGFCGRMRSEERRRLLGTRTQDGAEMRAALARRRADMLGRATAGVGEVRGWSGARTNAGPPLVAAQTRPRRGAAGGLEGAARRLEDGAGRMEVRALASSPLYAHAACCLACVRTPEHRGCCRLVHKYACADLPCRLLACGRGDAGAMLRARETRTRTTRPGGCRRWESSRALTRRRRRAPEKLCEPARNSAR